MRIQGRLSNPLLRRVQRHTRISTLFRVPPVEMLPVGAPPAPARPVPARLPPAESDLAPSIAPPPSDLSSPLADPTAASVQTFPGPLTSPAVPAARIPAAQPAATYAPVIPSPQPAVTYAPVIPSPASAQPTPVLPIPPAEAEEDRNWKRLQTIMRKHTEKEQDAQAQTEDQPQAAPGEPPPAAAPEIPPERPTVPPPAAVQRRSSVVEELPEVSAPRPAPPGEQPQIQPAPPLVEFTAPGDRIIPDTLQPGQPRIDAPSRLVEPQAETASLPLKPVSLAPPPEVESPVVPPESAGVAASLEPSPVPIQRQLEPQAPSAAPAAGEAQPAVQSPPSDSPSPTAAAAAEAPTVQLPRASLVADQPIQPEERPHLQAQDAPTAQPAAEVPPPAAPQPAAQQQPTKPAAAQLPPTEPDISSQPEGLAVPVPPPTVPAPQEASAMPAVQTAAEQLASQPSLPLVKASLPGSSQVQRVPETGLVTPPQALVAPPVLPVAEPQPGYLEPPPAAEVPVSAAPLESIWPVQRLPEAAQPHRAAAETTPGETPAVLPHDEHLGQILQSVAPGLPSDSSVELVTPRKPRPPAARKATPPAPKPEPDSAAPSAGTRPEAPPLQREVVQPGQPPAVPARVEPVPAPPAAVMPPEMTSVPTEIGPLPADLWSLIGQPAPETPAPPEKPAPVRPVRQSTLQHHMEEKETLQRTAAQPASPSVEQASSEAPVETQQARVSGQRAEAAGGEDSEAYLEPEVFSAERLEPAEPVDVIQRAVEVGEISSEVESAVAEAQPASSAPNVEELAQRVYQEIRRRLSIEFERWRRSG